jgi:signal transduction histidine kinase
MRRRSLIDAAIIAAIALLYIASAKLGLALAFRAHQVTSVWPPTGFAIAVVFRLGLRRGIPGILLGAFIANATAQEPLGVAAGIAIGNTLEAIVGAALLRRLDFDHRLARVRDVGALIAAILISPFVSATAGVICLVAGNVQPPSLMPSLWWLWWMGDALGGLIVAPLVFALSDRESLVQRRGAILEGVALMIGLVVCGAITFVRLPQIAATEYVVFPFLVWAALRFGPAGAAMVLVVTNAVAVYGTQLGRGPFAGAGPEQGLVLLQIFMAVAATTGLLLAAVAAQNRQAQERKDEFLAMLGHELRNPLAPIVNAIELLGGSNRETIEQAREIIRRQSEHLTRLIGDLLDVSRITRGAIHLDRRNVTLDDVVQPAVDTWRHLIEQQRQRLVIELPKESVWLDVDPTRFTQIVSNLIHNAAKFTPPEGRIDIKAEVQGGWLELVVRDDGEGMEPDMLARAFDLFVQGPPPLDRPRGGLGLGLTLVRRLAVLHGGTVEAFSEGEGSGCEFRVRMPVVDPPVAQLATALAVNVPQPRAARRVLVVEDNADARRTLALLLEEEGHDVRTAPDGKRALAEAEAFSPEIVLLDIGLPGIDGYEVARMLRALPQCSNALLVAVTGYGQAGDRARSNAAGFDHHLLKPVEPRRLLELVRMA